MKKFWLMTGLLILIAASSSRTSAHPATGIVVDRRGQVYFSDLETVWKLDIEGRLSVFRAGVSGRHVHELAIDADDNIYGADLSYEPATRKWPTAVWKMTPAGKLTWIQETSTNPPSGMSIWIDRAGNMYSVDQNNHTKTRTLVLRRTPNGNVSTFAGGSYGHTDGQGTAARFSSVGGMAFGPDGSIYLTDGNSVRRISMDGTVTTVATGLDFETGADRTRLFAGSSGSLTGLTVDAEGTVYVADGGKRRLLKITRNGKVDVVYRADPPFFPNGVFASPSGDVFALEVGFTLPNQTSGPRIRKLGRDGSNRIIATVGAETAGTMRSVIAQAAGTTAESALEFLSRRLYYIIVIAIGLAVVGCFVWRRWNRDKPA